MKFKIEVPLIVFFSPGFPTWILREQCEDGLPNPMRKIYEGICI